MSSYSASGDPKYYDDESYISRSATSTYSLCISGSSTVFYNAISMLPSLLLL